ncbi:Reverse transcriptase (RNA-dependent DNA polymerase) [Salinibacillus kushneri]|uniref:Reverse transcriptase (RNA-dependent DNA polymerase) n=1 Tax=Salinibacillus kushneri TaxID=237682 RepID=A0A1H9ZFI8_9BACI|nr:reverse transcriptase family protein [Salinibacillus kushneri]SES79819.1 Reverse transcriptase (RNA-dependent DNA polymerase) [Salinibacillus kushneri]
MLISQPHSLFELHNKRRLASLLKTDVENFNRIEERYTVYPFKKKVGKKVRTLFNTDQHYKSLLRRLNKMLCKTNIPDYVYAGIPKRDFLDNALIHRQKPYIQTADIQNFFPSTRDSYVYGLLLHKFHTSPDVAKIITQLTTYPLDSKTALRHIPQGFPTSTILSFLSYFDLFNGIYNLCKQNDIHFTLFVDDMTFSSHKRIPKSFLRHINSIVKKYDLQLHPSKIHRMNPYNYKTVTGVVIDPCTGLLKAPNKLQRKMFNNFKAIHNYSINTFNDYIQFKQLVLKLEGQLKSINRIEPNRQMPYITTVVKDIKRNFITHSVKGSSRDVLKSEYEFFVK